MTSTFLFLMMIMTGPQSEIEKIPKEVIVSMKIEMRQFAKEQQINEYKDVYEYEDWDFHNELNGYWENFQELNVNKVPRLENFNNRFNFQGEALFLIGQNLTLNRRFESFIQKKIDWEQDRAYFYLDILNESKECREVWYKIETINDLFYAGAAMKRRAYKNLKSVISEEDWLNPNYIPPCVPEWRFYEEKK